MRLPRNTLVLALLMMAGCGGGGGDVGVPDVAGGVLQPGGPAEVDLMPARSDYRVGETVILDVVVRRAENVGTVVFHLRYDSGALEFIPPGVEGTWMNSDGSTTIFLATEAGPGELVVGLSRSGAGTGIDGEGRLVTFRFLAVGEGASDFAFSGASVKDPTARNLPAVFLTRQVQVAR